MSSARTGFLIRDLRPGDFQGLVDAYYSYYKELGDDAGLGITLYRDRPSYASELDWFSRLYRDVENGDCVSKVAVVDGIVVGMCSVARQRPGSETDHIGVLGIAIRSGYRNRGIGRALMRSTIAACRGRLEAIRLGVFSNNRHAISLYESFGFRRLGTMPGAVKRGRRYLDEDFMLLDLRA